MPRNATTCERAIKPGEVITFCTRRQGAALLYER